MSISQFDFRKNTFTVLDLTARLSFKTASSLSFFLERQSKSLLPTRQIGWIDLHFPCDGHIKLQIRISLPSDYHSADTFRTIVSAAIAATGVPTNETYEAVLFGAAGVIMIEQPVDPGGVTDRLSA
jgi:hypothetical protein